MYPWLSIRIENYSSYSYYAALDSIIPKCTSNTKAILKSYNVMKLSSKFIINFSSKLDANNNNNNNNNNNRLMCKFWRMLYTRTCSYNSKYKKSELVLLLGFAMSQTKCYTRHYRHI